MLGYRHGGKEGKIHEEDQNNRFTRGFGTDLVRHTPSPQRWIL